MFVLQLATYVVCYTSSNIAVFILSHIKLNYGLKICIHITLSMWTAVSVSNALPNSYSLYLFLRKIFLIVGLNLMLLGHLNCSSSRLLVSS